MRTGLNSTEMQCWISSSLNTENYRLGRSMTITFCHDHTCILHSKQNKSLTPCCQSRQT
jgi:hypothetical protein